MNLIQLKYFLAICTHGTVSVAAQHMHVSQPSLSASIKALEDEFGVTLFRRGRHGMTLTSEGEALYNMSRDLISRAEQTERTMNDLGRARKTLRLGVPPMIGSLLLPRIFREFVERNPDVSLEITEGGRRELLSRLSDDFVDMVLLPHTVPLDSTLSSVHAARFELACCVSSVSPLAGKSYVALSELGSSPLILFNDAFFQTEQLKRRFAEAGITPNVFLQTNQLSTVVSMVSNGVGVGFMFEEIVENSSNIVALPLAEPMHADASLAWKKGTRIKDAMRRMKEYIANM